MHVHIVLNMLPSPAACVCASSLCADAEPALLQQHCFQHLRQLRI